MTNNIYPVQPSPKDNFSYGKLALHAASFTSLAPLYWEPLVRELANNACKVYFPEELEEKYVNVAQNCLRSHAPHLEKENNHIFGEDALHKAEIDCVINFAPIGSASGCSVPRFSGKTVLAIDARSDSLAEALERAQASGVDLLMTDAFPGTFGEGVADELLASFKDKIIYLPPILEEQTIKGLHLKEGRRSQSILLVFDSRELRWARDDQYRLSLAKSVELVQRSFDVATLDLGNLEGDHDSVVKKYFGHYNWCIVDLKKDAANLWVSALAIQNGMRLLYWNKPEKAIVRNALHGLKVFDSIACLPEELDGLRAHMEPLLEIKREEINQKPDEWINDAELYRSALAFSGVDAQLKRLNKLIGGGKPVLSSGKVLEKSLLASVYDNLDKLKLPDELAFRMPPYHAFKKIMERYGLLPREDICVRKLLYMISNHQSSDQWSRGIRDLQLKLIDKLHASQLAGLGDHVCYSLPGAQANAYPNYVRRFSMILKAVFGELRINPEGVDHIANNFVCGLLKWVAEQLGEPKKPQQVRNQYWEADEWRYLQMIGKAKKIPLVKDWIVTIYRENLYLREAFGHMVSASGDYWDLFDPAKRALLAPKAQEMIELLQWDLEYKRAAPDIVTQFVFLNLALGNKAEALRCINAIAVPDEHQGRVNLQNAFVFWVMGYPDESKKLMKENSPEFMEKADELLLHGCMSVLLGLLQNAKVSFSKLKRLHPNFFSANDHLSEWNEWLLLAMACKRLGKNQQSEQLLKIARQRGDPDIDAKLHWMNSVQPLDNTGDPDVIPEFSLDAGEDERELLEVGDP